MSTLNRRELLATMVGAAAGAATAEQQKSAVALDDRSSPHPAGPADGAVATWASSTRPLSAATRVFADPFFAGFENQTLRQCAFTSAGGDAPRIRVSNLFGTQPLRIAKAALGVKRAGQAGDAELIAHTVVPITFCGSRSVTIPPGQEISSDAASTTLLPHQTIAVDLYFLDKTGAPEISSQFGLTYCAEGDRAGVIEASSFSRDTRGTAAMRVDGWYYLRGVDVRNPMVKDVIVCGADSLSHSSRVQEGHMKWPQILSRRLREKYGDGAPSVVQSTLMGNRLLTSGPLGPCVLERFQSDMLTQPGITKLILWAGFNDLVYSNFPAADWTGPRPTRSAEELIGGYMTLIEKAHARGVKIYGCTMSPGRDAFLTVDGKRLDAWSDASETTRRKLNDWFKSAGTKAFDGVFDFASAIENPLDHASYDPSCSADGVHPNAGGHYAIAHAIDIKTLMA